MKSETFFPSLYRHNSVSYEVTPRALYMHIHYWLEAYTLILPLTVRWVPGDVLWYSRVLMGKSNFI